MKIFQIDFNAIKKQKHSLIQSKKCLVWFGFMAYQPS